MSVSISRAPRMALWLLLAAPLVVPGRSEGQQAHAGDVAAGAPAEARQKADPFAAYDEGRWAEAAAGFAEAPLDENSRALNIGAAHYRLEDFEAARAAFERALTAEDPALRAEALYNLGNAAFRAGDLPGAIERYRSALELAPEDEDAKFNLEVARQALERWQQQQQHQQEQQQEQQGEEPNASQSQDQGASGEGSENEGEPREQPEDGRGEDFDPNEGGQPGDRDGDGLPDEVERSGENPTDPANPDTDGDGRRDGEEDANRNGRRDPGETDPNRRDAPGDAEAPAESTGSMSLAEARRYLESLTDERPAAAARHRGRVRRGEKDW